MDHHAKSTLRRVHDAAAGYHLLVALLFTGCLPLALARAAGGPSSGGTGPIAAALDTARAAAAHAFSLPG